ncbi:HPr family phosphocarrier protein [Lacrimispora saccharolytica]|uniref:Phosphocarrier protein HPr n=1 Tax=Lacrimispora saccharolytica (strain ATCC 35040 / DSM 2544 / NRCC 2533 / WM1) TaxID=610130 RepID=D9R299_LACSW|nr:HPr family phosphocarrier protein [Lacrimispora saccharolytica]ADL04749.1 Phosphotransferase system, phosphocarrier protein HPr [[Clostridium] saccharolyticum WM1]QRV21030.1 HPr family phosphocarrier protein [Lacrimispora saccharolytica]
MREYLYELNDPMGLHARPASLIFMEARKYCCSIEAHWESDKADCKSLLSLMGLGVTGGSVIRFKFDGEDEDAAITGIRAVLEKI